MVLSLKTLTYNIISREREDEKGMFLKRVGMLLDGGYSLKEILEFLLKFEKNKTKEWILSIQKGLKAGSSFHKELERLGFSDKIVSQVYIASQYGHYGQTITQCGDHLLGTLEKKKKMRTLATYPVFLLMFLLGMLLLMRFMIFPHLETLFVSIGSEQDIFSHRVITFVYFAPHILVGLLLVSLLVFLFIHLKSYNIPLIEKIRLLTRIPLLNNYVRDYFSHFFFFEWGNLLLNGCSMLEVINIMKGEDASRLLIETGEFLSIQMNQGQSVYEALSHLPYFYTEGLQVVSHGENLGKLGMEMLVYANHCESQLNQRVEKLMNRLQPVVFVLVGIMILIIYGALMLPVFNLMEGF